MARPIRLRERLVILVPIEDDETAVIAPYRARPIIKALPRYGRRWDADRGEWVIRAVYTEQLAVALVAAGFEVDVCAADGSTRTLGGGA